MDRRRVSVQWFSGTILTGLCGAALMSGAVFAALDGETNFATVPERVEAALRGSGSAPIASAIRPARPTACRPPARPMSARQVIRVTTTTRGANNREIVRVRPFVRVAGNLSLSVSELTANIPRFNAQKMLASSDGAAAAADDAGAEPDAEVSFFTRDLNTRPAAGESRRRRAASTKSSPGCAMPPTGTVTPASARCSRTPCRSDAWPTRPTGHDDVYGGFEPRIVPENITLLPKTTTQTNGGNAWNERTIVLKKGDSVSAILRELGATRRRDQGDHRRLRHTRPGHDAARRLQAAGAARAGAAANGCSRCA